MSVSFRRMQPEAQNDLLMSPDLMAIGFNLSMAAACWASICISRIGRVHTPAK